MQAPISISEIRDELQITQVHRFQDNMAYFRGDNNQQELETSDNVVPSLAQDTFKKINHGTLAIAEQCRYFSQLLDFIQERRIIGINNEQQQPEQEEYKILCCKMKTIYEIVKQANLINPSVLYDFLYERKKEEEELIQQVLELKSKANFATYNSLRLFSRQCPLDVYAPNNIYMNLYCDSLWTPSLGAKDYFHPIERVDARLIIKQTESKVMDGELVILLKRKGEVIYSSGPAPNNDPNQVTQTRDKYIENVIIFGWLRDSLKASLVNNEYKLLDDWTLEVQVQNTAYNINRKPILYQQLLDTIYKRENIACYIDYLKTYIVLNQDYVKQKFGTIDATRCLSKIQFDSLDFFQRVQLKPPSN